MFIGTVVVGDTVEAAYYALVNSYTFIDTRTHPPLFYKKLPMSILGHQQESVVWEKLNTLLGLMSKRIHVSKTDTIKLQDKSIKIVRGTSIFEYLYSTAFVFNATRLKLQNNISESREKKYLVIDDFELSSLGPKKYSINSLIRDSEFAKELHFYSSDRVDGSKYITDCVLVSELTQKQLSDFEYSDSIGKIFIERYLTEIGIHGSFMKYNLNGSKKYRRPKVVHVSRMSFERDSNRYDNSKCIKFINPSLEQIIEESA